MDCEIDLKKELSAHKNDIGYMIKTINDTLEKRANTDLREHGLTFSQVRTMHYIFSQENYQTTQKKIEEFFGVSHPTINGILKRLEEKGKITTEIAVNRRLTKIVRMTEDGKEYCQNSDFQRIRHENILSKYLENNEKEILLNLLRKVCKGLQEDERKID